ncbi:MAG: hypothetical protein KDC48_11390, partial [Planctomycetes bacterium]|nr:hypothetical protein [Planctomycetota bacterium]
MKPTTILWCAAAVAACAQAAHPSDQATQRLAEAQRTLATDPERSLRITDELLAAAPDWRQARLCAAEGSLRLARTGTSTRKDLLLSDAVRNYERGIEGEEPAANPTAWLQLAECHYELGEFVTAADVAGQAATAFLSAKPANETQAAEAQLLVGRSYYRQFTAARQDELDNKEPDHRGVVVPEKETTRLATGAITAFEAARRQRPGEATTQIALVYQWLGQSQAVIAEYERGIRTAPGEAAIHDAYIAWMDNIGQREAMVGAYGRFVRENPSVPVLRWHQGRALYGRADQLRAEGNFQGAIEGYEKARATFADYGAQMPRHKDSVGQWLALCELSIARTSVEIGDLAGAREHLFAADAASPLTAAEENGRPQLVDSFGQHYAGVAFAIHRATAEIATDPLRATLSFNEALLARHPDRWGWVYNNAALAARDLGVQVAKDGKEQEATQLWERSYALYQKAVVLSPDDARIVNDCGLMLIYHLHRDYGRARELFEQAIAVGQKQLDALPADTDQKERELLEEAVGDAWQNIAVLLRDHEHRPFADYREFCERAVKFYPYQRREAAGMLRDGAAQHAPNTADAAAQGGAADAFAKAQKAAKAKADSGDLDGALGEVRRLLVLAAIEGDVAERDEGCDVARRHDQRLAVEAVGLGVLAGHPRLLGPAEQRPRARPGDPPRRRRDRRRAALSPSSAARVDLVRAGLTRGLTFTLALRRRRGELDARGLEGALAALRELRQERVDVDLIDLGQPAKRRRGDDLVDREAADLGLGAELGDLSGRQPAAAQRDLVIGLEDQRLGVEVAAEGAGLRRLPVVGAELRQVLGEAPAQPRSRAPGELTGGPLDALEIDDPPDRRRRRSPVLRGVH